MISEWLLPQSVDVTVAVGTIRKTHSDLIHDTACIANGLKQRSGNRIAIALEDNYDFLCVLLATLSIGKIPVLLGSRTTLSCSESSLFDHVVASSKDNAKTIGFPDLLAMPPTAIPPILPTAKMHLCTSGSTGMPKIIEKTVSLMDAESRITAKLFQKFVAGTLLVSCVDNSHLYGLTFSLWMPLSLGIPIYRQRVRFQEDFPASQKPLAVITTPTFLRNLDETSSPLQANFVLSAGGILPHPAIAKAWRFFQCDVSEIYGSTESGVVGTRCHRKGSVANNWRLCPEIAITAGDETKTTIRTPLHPDGRFELEDQLKINRDGSFELLGRKDRIVKIGEERISLDEISEKIQQICGLSACTVGVMHHACLRIGVVVENTQGTDFSKAKIPDYVNSLRGSIPAVALPRYWRAVSAFPVTERGKIDYQKMKAMFDVENNGN